MKLGDFQPWRAKTDRQVKQVEVIERSLLPDYFQVIFWGSRGVLGTVTVPKGMCYKIMFPSNVVLVVGEREL